MYGSVSGRTPPRLRLFWRRAETDQLRQHQSSGGAALRPARTGTDAFLSAAEKPPFVQFAFLPGAASQREGACREFDRVRSAQFSRASAPHGELHELERAIGGTVPRRVDAYCTREGTHEGCAAGRRTRTVAALADGRVRYGADRAGASKLAVAGALRPQRLLGADGVRASRVDRQRRHRTDP